jgi:hypothetical protein
MPKPKKHKRKKPKSGRAGCLLCKPHKDQRAKDTNAAKTVADKIADLKEKDEE